MPLQIRSNACTSFLRENLLTILTIIGVVSGTLLGWGLRASGIEWSRRDVMYFQYPGELFLRMLKSLIVPLLVSSIVSAIGSLDLSLSGKVGLRAIIYYMTTTICAVMLGIALVTTIKPGKNSEEYNTNSTKKLVTKDTLTSDTLLDLIRNVFPENLAQATIASYRTRLTYDQNDTKMIKGHLETYKIEGDYQSGSNVLGLVCFSVVLGITLGKMGEQSRPLQAFFHSLSEAMMIITGWVIWLSPLGVFFLVTAKIMEIESFGELVGRLGLYFMTVLLGLFLHGFGTLSILFILATKKLPCRYIAKMGQVMATAFGTASSSATMPITIGCCDDMGLDPRITRFVIPIGATINMDGTALYEAVAAIFIAQMRKVDMSFGKIVAVSVTATAASIGAAGIPQAGLVTMVMVLDTVNLPAEDVSIILAVDWLLNVFPENLAQATIASYRTRLTYDQNDTKMIKGHLETYKIEGDYQSGSNVLGLVCFSVVLGITLGKMGEQSRPLQAFFHSLSEAMMIITGWVIWLSPLGVFFLVTAKIMEIESFGELVGRLGLYFMTVLLGLFLHGFGTLSILFILATKKLPCRYIAKMGQVMATAFGTASSSATMPITIGCCDDMGLDPRITRFVIPIGATINMDGTALYEAVAAIFIAQMRKVDMSFGKIVAVSVTATAASIGAAGIPQAGLVTMVMVLDTVNLPAEDVSIILAVDWLLDRFRTTINVVCDALGAIIVTSLSQGDIEKSRALQNDREVAPAHELTELEKGEH